MSGSFGCLPYFLIQIKPGDLFRLVTVGGVLGVIAALILDIWNDFERYKPAGGLVILIGLAVVFSRTPRKVTKKKKKKKKKVNRLLHENRKSIPKFFNCYKLLEMVILQNLNFFLVN